MIKLSPPETSEKYAGRMTRIGMTTFLVLLHVGLAIMVMVLVNNLEEWDGLLVLLVVGFGSALYAWLFSHAVLSDLERVETALMKLARGEVINPLPTRGREPVRFMMEHVNALIERQRELFAMRQQLAGQIGEAAAQEERSRLARDLHDSIKQQIFSINVSAAGAQARWESDPDGARAALADVRKSAQEAMVEMRAMLQQLAPAPLEKVGLVQALRDQCEALQYRSGAQVTTEIGDLPPDERLPVGAQEAIFRIAQEALTNIARHARAQQVILRLHAPGETVQLEIVDDGHGFDTDAPVQGMGLGNMKARASAIGGTLDIVSGTGGTQLRLRVPQLAPLPALVTESPTLAPDVAQAFQHSKSVIASLGVIIFIALVMGFVPLLAIGRPDLPLWLIVVNIAFGLLSLAGIAHVVLNTRKAWLSIQQVFSRTGQSSVHSLLLRYYIWLSMMLVPVFGAIFLPALAVEWFGTNVGMILGSISVAASVAAFAHAFRLYARSTKQLSADALRIAARDNFPDSTWTRYCWAASIPMLMNLGLDFPPQFPPQTAGDWLDVSLPGAGVFFLLMYFCYWQYHRRLRRQVEVTGETL
ncbi:MAG: sensor histidine kinase [Chloroflexota bacterium]|nr:sensor histidine kinase [Chloroflexota bacterium]